MAARLAGDHVQALDGLRGMAAVMVVASHASGLGMDLLPGVALTGIGKHGVYLFFVLSAFLLTWQWLADWPAAGQGWRRLLEYLLGRFARIFPLYVLVLLAAWVLGGHGLGVAMDADRFWRHVGLQQGDGIYWSIPVEFHYYLLLPMVAAVLAFRAPLALRLAIWLMVLVAALLAYPAASAPASSDQLGYYLPVLLCGSLAAFLHRHLSAPGGGLKPGRRIGLPDLLFAVGLALTTPSLYQHMTPLLGTEALHRAFLAWGLAWSVVLLALLHGRLPAASTLFSSLAMRTLGRWSFGLYLLHLPALYLARLLPMPGPLRAWVGLLIAVGVSALAYRWIERPAMLMAAGWRAGLLKRAA